MSSPSSFGTRMIELRCNDETSNVGTKWTIEEDTKLVQEITENKTYEEIALEHKRTVHGIKLRLISHIIYPKIKDAATAVADAADADIDMEELALEYKIDTSQLIRQIDKLKMKGIAKKEKQKPKPINDDMPTNKDILEYLKQLDNKINEINSKLDNLEYLR
jgi:hypothetical protein